jgi:hypothetical protein
LRDLKYVEEELGQAWAGELAKFLVRAKVLNEEARSNGSGLDPGQISKLRKEYTGNLMAGKRINPEPVKRPGKKGKTQA